jgi:hypothetical protein
MKPLEMNRMAISATDDDVVMVIMRMTITIMWTVVFWM